MKRLIAFLLFALVAFLPEAHARRRWTPKPVAVVAAGVTYYTGNGASGNSVSVTLAAPLVNGYAVYYIMESQTGGGPWGATFNGSTMTDILADGGPVSSRSYILRGQKLGNLAAGTYSVVGTGGISSSACAVAIFNGVNQTTSTGVVVGDFQFAGTMTLTPASTTSDLVVMCAGYAGGGTTVSSYGGASQVHRTTGDDTVDGNHVDISTAPGAASTTTVTVNLSGSVNFLSFAFSLKP